MTDDNSNLVDMDNLDNFSKTFFGDEPVATDETNDEPQNDEEDIPENEDDALATDEDTDASEDENPAEDEAPSDDNSEEPEEEPEEEEKPQKKGKKSFQDRINELTAKAREAERREAALLMRLETIEADSRKPEYTKSEPKPLREQLSEDAPNPDAVDENGELVYPLGEFDKAYVRDLTRFTIKQETEAAEEVKAQKEQQRMVEAAQEELKSSWLQKVADAEEDLPDLREKLGEMDTAFTGIAPNYGEFLAATIMACDNGPQMMYYLSQNIGEAQKIVASGPAAATLALGRLDAKFAKTAKQEDKRNTKKQSSAPRPPESRTRGSGTRSSVAPDTDDLKAFEREFYKK